MTYLYECRNEDCKNFNSTKEVDKPMAESGREEKCEECDKTMERVYTTFAMRNGDGFSA